MPSEWFNRMGKKNQPGATTAPADSANKEEKRPGAQAGRPVRLREQDLNAEEEQALRRIRERLASEELADLPEHEQQQKARSIVLEETSALPRARREAVMREVLQYLGGGLGPLQPFMDDPDVTEIMVNRPDQVYVERQGTMVLTDVRFRSDEEVRALVERLVSRVGRNFNLSEPMVDARLPESGSRLNAVMPPLALLGTSVTIRKFPHPFTFEELVDSGTIPPDVAGILKWAVPNRLNVVVSGGTGSGKSTLLNVLTSLIPDRERLVIVEDAAELQPQQPHVVRLESRPPNVEGKGEVRIRELVRNALRMRPDRIIVGEVRGGEALDMLQAMNTGHPGSMTTVHANSPRDTLLRLESMVLMAGTDMPLRAIRQQIGSAVHLIVQIARVTERDGDALRVRRRIVEVVAVRGFDPATGDIRTETIYEAPAAWKIGTADVPEWARPWFEEGGQL